VDQIVSKYYSAAPMQENTDRLKFVVNLFNQTVPSDHPIWDKRWEIAPRREWNDSDYEVCIGDIPADLEPVADALQRPFMLFSTRGIKMRKKQNCSFLIKSLRRSCTKTTAETIERFNEDLKAAGLYPYDHSHPVFEYLKVQGLNY